VIPLREQAILRDRFAAEIVSPVRIDFFTQKQTGIHIPGREECRSCDDARVLMEEIAAISGGRITLTVYDLYADRSAARRDQVDKVPCAALRGANRRRIRHYGLPIGSSFPGLIAGLGLLASGQSPLKKALLRRLGALPNEVHMEVLVGKNDQLSAAACLLAYQFAVASEKLRVDVVEMDEFPRLAQQYNVRAVPVTVLNGRLFCVGFQTEEALVDQIEAVASGRVIQPPPGPSTPYAVPSAEVSQQPGRRLPSGLILP
jgi:alkyl hydroperoxide reductase subunit AhpF